MSDTKTDSTVNEMTVPTGRRGFPGFRRPEIITDQALADSLSRLAGGPSETAEYIYYTGGPYNYRAPSMRSNALRSLKVVREPVLLSDFLRLAARVTGPEEGYDPKAVKQGLFLHLGSKPAVYLALRRLPSGAYVSSRKVPYCYDHENPGRFKKVEPGDVIIPAAEATEPATLSLSGGASPALVEAPIDQQKRLTTKGKGRSK